MPPLRLPSSYRRQSGIRHPARTRRCVRPHARPPIPDTRPAVPLALARALQSADYPGESVAAPSTQQPPLRCAAHRSLQRQAHAAHRQPRTWGLRAECKTLHPSTPKNATTERTARTPSDVMRQVRTRHDLRRWSRDVQPVRGDRAIPGPKRVSRRAARLAIASVAG